MKSDIASLTSDDADEVRMVLPRRHKIDQRCRTIFGLEARLEDQRIGSVAAPDADSPSLRCYLPAAVIGLSQ